MFAMWCYRRMSVGPNVLHTSGDQEARKAKALKIGAAGRVDSSADMSRPCRLAAADRLHRHRQIKMNPGRWPGYHPLAELSEI
jgi:hypothetical protein